MGEHSDKEGHYWFIEYSRQGEARTDNDKRMHSNRNGMQCRVVQEQGHSVFVEALHDRFPKAIKGCVRGGALLPRHPPREPQPSPQVEPDANISASAH